ncbi:MAG: prepilin-type N-terminal cleavage/methylation domain-containing protein [Lachnospiraceae bacterium]|nr:prepilin-type N-terminal cleavage/methylation domain-containing protein [Lachnospiraceae bacterium]
MRIMERAREPNNKGFSLIELIIVVAIMAILVGILAPQYVKYVERTRKAADVSNLDNLVAAIKVASSDGTYNIPAGYYAITMWDDHVTYKYKVTKNASYNNISGDALEAVKEYTGIDFSIDQKNVVSGKENNQYSISLKSSRWVNENPEITNTNYPDKLKKTIQAVIYIESDGRVTVEYKPASITIEMSESN